MKLLGYIRTSEKELHHRIEAQDTLLHLYCELHAHHSLTDVIVDKNVDASIPFAKRRGGEQAMRRLQEGHAKGLLMTSLNRVFELNMNGLVQSLWFDQYHLSILTVQDQVDTSEPDGWRNFAVKMINAEYEYRRISWQDKFTHYAFQAKPADPPYIPFGCILLNPSDQSASHYRLYRDPIIWQVREIILELYQQSMSPRHICEYLQREQIPSPSGAYEWHVSTILGIIESHDSLKCIPFRPDRRETVEFSPSESRHPA